MKFVRECTQCGKCCKKYGGVLATVGREEYERLPDHAKKYAGPLGDNGRLYDLWVKDGYDCDRCPFLKKRRGIWIHECSIYDCRPDVCRNYPVSLDQAIDDGCEMVGAA